MNAVDSIQRMAYGQTVKDTPFHDIFVVPKVQRSVDWNFNGLQAVLCISCPQNSSYVNIFRNKVEDILKITLSSFDKAMFCIKIWVFYGGFLTGKHRVQACSNTNF